ncbi:MAG: DUF2786 domain-containing protein [Egibacteraceae bacterium]
MVHRRRRRPHAGRPPIDELLRPAMQALRLGTDSPELAALAADLDAAVPAAGRLVDEDLAAALARGWNPAELVHVADVDLEPATVAVLAAAVHEAPAVSEAAGPRWRGELEDLAGRAREAARVAGRDRLYALLACASFLEGLPTVPATTAAAGARRPSQLDARVLARVRALLAKAESTAYEEEAEALSAKAQALIAQHAIDEALLAAGSDDVGAPGLRRILLSGPYLDAQHALIAAVARANRCQAIYEPWARWVSLLGYDTDLDAIDLLATSLLAQATQAMRRHGPKRDAAGRSRTRSFRRSFLLGYAGRIGERLREATDAQVAEAGGDALPVLASREERVAAAVRETFPRLQTKRSSVSNGGGWHAGRAAADEAELNAARRRLRRR